MEHGIAPIYLVAGDGDDRQRLEILAEREGVGDLVRFLGYVPREELAESLSCRAPFYPPFIGRGIRYRAPGGDGVRHSRDGIGSQRRPGPALRRRVGRGRRGGGPACGPSADLPRSPRRLPDVWRAACSPGSLSGLGAPRSSVASAPWSQARWTDAHPGPRDRSLWRLRRHRAIQSRSARGDVSLCLCATSVRPAPLCARSGPRLAGSGPPIPGSARALARAVRWQRDPAERLNG